MESLLFEAPAAIVVIGLDGGQPTRLNRECTREFGFTQEDVPTLEALLEKAFPIDARRSEARAWWDELAAGGPPVHHAIEWRELALVDKAGAARNVLARARVLPGEIVVALVDVTERRRVEEQLRISEARHRTLADNALDVVWTMALDGTITYVSPAVERLRGITPEVAKRQPLDEIHPPDSAAKSMGYFQQLFAAMAAGTELPKFRGELEYKCADGSTAWTEAMAMPLVDEDGKVVEILGVSRDLRERKQAELAIKNALAENQRLVDELRRALSDVKTLSGLLPICMFCKKIRDDSGYWDRIETYLSTHTDVQFTHGMCADCEKTHYQD